MCARPRESAPAGVQPFVPHPLTDRVYWEAVRAEPRHAALWAEVEKTATAAPARPTPPSATDYLAARRHNDRSPLDRVWRESGKILPALALRRCARGLDPGDPDDGLLDWLWGMLTLPSWAVSAHLPGNDLPASGAPTLDLAACEMAAQMAEIRECLKPWLDSVSGTLAGSLVAEIDARVLTPYGQGAKVWWQEEEGGKFLNWTGVCAGSILVACESLGAQGFPRPQARARALAGLRLFLERAFTPHGECDEGLGYWHYGVEFACLGWSRLGAEEFRRAVDLERLRLVADYPRRAHLFGDWFFNGNDAGPRAAAQVHFIPWLAGVLGDAWLAEWARRYPALEVRNFAMLLRTLDAPPPEALPALSDWEDRTDKPRLLPDQQAALFRVAQPQGDLLVCLTGGHNAERHNHNDLGHFCVFCGGVCVIPDLGAPHYTADFFGPQRYTHLAASSRGHCCPLIGEHEQREGAEAAGRIVAWEPDAPTPRIVLDLTSAYAPEAGLREWRRGLERRAGAGGQPARLVIGDFFHTREPDSRLTHVLWSLEPLSEVQEGVEGGGLAFMLGPLLVELSPAPTALSHVACDPADFRLREFAGRKLYRIEAVVRTDAQGRLALETRFSMG